MSNQTFFFENFPKNPSEMISNPPFNPILIPNTPYVRFGCKGVQGGPKGFPKGLTEGLNKIVDKKIIGVSTPNS